MGCILVSHFRTLHGDLRHKMSQVWWPMNLSGNRHLNPKDIVASTGQQYFDSKSKRHCLPLKKEIAKCVKSPIPTSTLPRTPYPVTASVYLEIPCSSSRALFFDMIDPCGQRPALVQASSSNCDVDPQVGYEMR